MSAIDGQSTEFGVPAGKLSGEMRSRWLTEVRRLIEVTRSRRHAYNYSVCDIELTILPDVFSPAYFADSTCFATIIASMTGTKRLLDIGTGTGIVALFAALKGADVIATDVSPQAVRNAQINFDKYNVSTTALEGDMFAAVPADQKFDFIFWNHPFNSGDNPNGDPLSLCCFDYQYHGLKRYIRRGHDFLAPGGRHLLGTSTLADLSNIQALARNAGYDIDTLHRENFLMQQFGAAIFEYRICEFVHAKSR